MEAVYVSNNSFSVVGSRIADFIAGRRVKIDCGIDGTIYAVVLSSTFTAVTTVVIDETSLTSNLTSVLYSPVKPGIEGNMPNHTHTTGEGDGGFISPLLDHTHSITEGDGGYIEPPTFEFTGLTDTPVTYSGSDGFYAQSTGSGIIFSEVVTQIDASGFDGNLTTTDDTLQEIAQKVDDLVIPTPQVIYNGEGPPEGTHIAAINDYYVDKINNVLHRKISEAGGILTKSIIIDITDGWGGDNIGIRSVELFDETDTLVPLVDSNFTAYQSSAVNSSCYAKYAFDTTLSKIGTFQDVAWFSAQNSVTNQRILCVLNTSVLITKVAINNHHYLGTNDLNHGCKNIIVTATSDTITSTTYNAAISNSTVVYAGELAQHISSNVADDQEFEISGIPTGWEVVLQTEEGITTFSGLSDTPSNYSDGLYAKSTGSGVEWVEESIPSISSGDVIPTTPGSLGDLYFDYGNNNAYTYRVLPAGYDTIYTAKSVILDIADNWGGDWVCLRSVDFWFEGSKITNIPTTDFLWYQTSAFNNTYEADKVFNTNLSKTGDQAGNEWLPSGGVVANQRLICVFNLETTFDKIVVNNSHHGAGGTINRGSKNVKISISTDTITSTAYNSVITNSQKIYDSTFDQHNSLDAIDDQILTTLPAIVGEGPGWGVSLESTKNFTELNDTPVTYLEGQYLRTTTSGIEAIDGIILRAPNDSEWLISVTNSGTLYTTGV